VGSGSKSSDEVVALGALLVVGVAVGAEATEVAGEPLSLVELDGVAPQARRMSEHATASRTIR